MVYNKAMRDFFYRLQNQLAGFMAGRNGIDKLAGICVGLALVFLIIEMFTNTLICSFISLALLTYALFRCYSRNTGKRAEENARFEAFLASPGSFFRRKKGADARRTKSAPSVMPLVFRCEQCGQSLSVPKGKGRIKVTCPRCRHQTLTKS